MKQEPSKLTVIIFLFAAWSLGAAVGNASTAYGTQRLRILSDGAAVAGIVLFLPGLLCCLSRWGAFNGLLYGLRVTGSALLPGRRQQIPSYGDYIQSRRNRHRRTERILLTSGSVLLLLSVVFAALFCRAL